MSRVAIVAVLMLALQMVSMVLAQNVTEAPTHSNTTVAPTASNSSSPEYITGYFDSDKAAHGHNATVAGSIVGVLCGFTTLVLVVASFANF